MPSALPAAEPLVGPSVNPDSDAPGEIPLQVHNFMEDMVLERLDHTLNVLNGCGCERCKKDILAIALNQLPSAYAVIQGDTTHYRKKLKGHYEIKVTSALIRAVQEVKKHPRH